MLLHQSLTHAINRLKAGSDSAVLDAQVLVAHVVGKSRAWVLAHPEAPLSPIQIATLETAIRRLEQGEPLPYVLGRWEFYGLEFEISPEVLIPRPETELLVEQALEWLRRRARSKRHLWAADVGTGSGCIAVTLASKIHELQVVASDKSFPALRVARQNARKYHVSERVHFIQADLLSPISTLNLKTQEGKSPASITPFDLICANLPYIPTATLHGLKVFGKEPDLALDGGPFGYDLIQTLLTQATTHLSSTGLLIMEIEANQGLPVSSLAKAAFPSCEVTILPDLAGRDRLLTIQADGHRVPGYCEQSFSGGRR